MPPEDNERIYGVLLGMLLAMGLVSALYLLIFFALCLYSTLWGVG